MKKLIILLEISAFTSNFLCVEKYCTQNKIGILNRLKKIKKLWNDNKESKDSEIVSLLLRQFSWSNIVCEQR